MINVKDQVYGAIKDIAENVGDTYPTNWAVLPAIQYTEEDNSVYERTGKGETKSHLQYRIDIWHNQSTSELHPLMELNLHLITSWFYLHSLTELEQKSADQS